MIAKRLAQSAAIAALAIAAALTAPAALADELPAPPPVDAVVADIGWGVAPTEPTPTPTPTPTTNDIGWG